MEAVVDGLPVEERMPWLKRYWPSVRAALLVGKVEIPKPNGGVRTRGIPTVLDRVHPAGTAANPATAVRTGMRRERTFLGYSFTWHRQARIKIAPSSLERRKARVRDLVRIGRGRNIVATIDALALFCAAGCRITG